MLQKIETFFNESRFIKANYWCDIQANPLTTTKVKFKTSITAYSNQLSIDAELDFPEKLTDEQAKKASRRATLDIILDTHSIKLPFPMVFRFHVIPHKTTFNEQKQPLIQVGGFLQEIFCYNQLLNRFIYDDERFPNSEPKSKPKPSYF